MLSPRKFWPYAIVLVVASFAALPWIQRLHDGHGVDAPERTDYVSADGGADPSEAGASQKFDAKSMRLVDASQQVPAIENEVRSGESNPFYEALVREAGNGNAAAALDLHMLLWKCRERLNLLERAEALITSRPASNQPGPDGIAEAERLLLAAEANSEECRSLGPDQIAESRAWLELAAASGNDDAILRFAAVGSPQEYSDKPAISMAEDLAEHERNAIKELHVVAANCSPGALISLANQYRVGDLVNPDSKKATTFFPA